MGYQTVWMARYNDKYLIRWPYKEFVKQVLVDVVDFVPPYLICMTFSISDYNYVMWILLALKVAVIWMTWIILVNFVFYRNRIIAIAQHLSKHNTVS